MLIQAKNRYVEMVHRLDPKFKYSPPWTKLKTSRVEAKQAVGAALWSSSGPSVPCEASSAPLQTHAHKLHRNEAFVYEDGEDDDETLLHIMFRRMITGKISPTLFFQSLFTSLGERAFFLVTSIFAFIALVLHAVTGGILNSKTIDPEEVSSP